jgi:hypothetical protein
MSASWMLVGMRDKEEVSILPITTLVYSLVIFALVKVSLVSIPLIRGEIFGRKDSNKAVD